MTSDKQKRLLANIILTILGCMAVFHLLVIDGTLPGDMVWGGKAVESEHDLLLMEVVSVFVSLLFMLVIAAKAGYILKGQTKPVNTAVWVVAVYFSLNIVGNLLSGSDLERIIFTPVAIVLAVLSFVLAVKK